MGEALNVVLAAGAILIGAPIYNFSAPSQLTSWLDAMTAPGKKFTYGPEGVTGLLGEIGVIVAAAEISGLQSRGHQV